MPDALISALILRRRRSSVQQRHCIPLDSLATPVNSLSSFLAKSPNNADAHAALDRAQRRCAERRTGEYDFKRLQVDARKLKPPQLDHATYMGPIEVRTARKKRRGLFVTKAVKAGELLLCEKTVSHAFYGENQDSTGFQPLDQSRWEILRGQPGRPPHNGAEAIPQPFTRASRH